ncbi:MAG: putative Ig domain-containing protein [Acidobacteriota bacterium]
MRLLPILVLASSLAPLSGCGINSSTLTQGSSQTPPATSHIISGHVHGGQQPVKGAVMQLWAVGTAGYGSPATPLISLNKTTDATGAFDITGDYSCTGNPLVYLTATGGNTGGSGNNDNLLLVAPLGYCNTLNASTQIQIDEVTTVAAAYALGQFTNTTTGSIGSWSYSNTGLVNAFTTVNLLTDISKGTALASTPSGVGNVPQSEIDTLGNIMAACVNSVSSNASLSTNCAAYFAAATPPAGAAPTDTFDAMVNIAHNPGRNVSTLFNLAVADPPFNPVLTKAPTDWTIGIAWKEQGSGSIAVDGMGNVWHLGYNSGGNVVHFLTPAGVLTSSNAFGENNVSDLAVDTNDHAWLFNGNNTLTALTLTTSGGVSSISSFAGPFTLSGVSGSYSLAIDGSNNLWLSPLSGLTKVSTSGTVLGTYTGGGYPSAADEIYSAVDNNGNVWTTSNRNGNVSEFSNSGTALSPSSGFSGVAGGLQAPVAIDASNDVWLVNAGNTISELSSTGTMLSPSGGYSEGSSASNFGVTVDGNGGVWVTSDKGIFSFTNSGVINNTTPYSPGSTGFSTHPMIDASGNLWFTGNLARGSNPIGLTQYVGVAAPVITPTASAIATHQLGTQPGTPIPVVLTSTQIPSTYGYNSAYSAQLHVTGGNTGTYLWSLSSGALPNGFTLNSSTGLISGTSTATGTSSFNVQVCDAQNSANCASQVFTLTGIPGGHNLPTLGGESLLNGNYAFRITGQQNAGTGSAPGSVEGMAMVGVLSWTGAGRVSGGDFYRVSPQGSSTDIDPTLVFGTYDLPAGGNGAGKLAFSDGNGHWYQFSITAGKIVGGAAQELRLTEFDDTQSSTGDSGGAMASGIAKLQTGAPYATTYLEQTFAFGLEGETPCTNYNSTNPTCGQTVAPFGPLAAAGTLTGTSATALSGKLDAAGVGTSYNNVSFTGTWTPPFNVYGFRGFLTLTYSGTLFPVPPATFAFYPVSDSEFFFISTDSHATTSMLSGDAIAQSGSFSNGSFNGVYLGVESVASGGDGQSVYGSTVNSAVHFTFSTGATAILITDENNAGTLSQVPEANSTYSVDSTGRITFTQAGLPIYYLANPTQGFGVKQPTAGDPSGLLTLTQQASGTFSASVLNGAYAFSDLNVPQQNTTADGLLTADGVSAGTLSADQVSTGGLLSSPSQGLGYNMTSAGRGTLTLDDGTNYILWMLSPAQWIALPTGTDPKPLILTGTHQ